jgi:ADP-ribosylglycohydrolase
METAQRASGCLFGLAIGDALGAPVEFRSLEEMVEAFPPAGPLEPGADSEGVIRVTDDTQMALAVGEALTDALDTAGSELMIWTPTLLESLLRRHFLRWVHSPDNDRAPGMTCLSACYRLERGLPWYEASIHSSKGCGATMRVAPVGLLQPERDGLSAETRAALAQFQAALTHGHPTALAAADLTAYAIAELVAGAEPLTLPERLRTYALQQRTYYHDVWLDRLWELNMVFTSPSDFIAHGWDECLAVLERLETALRRADRQSDPCLATGGGWIAEEALATSLLCFLLFVDDPLAALRRAALTSGDSDTLACLTGAFAGAYHGLAAWPTAWIERLEYRERLLALGQRWD